MRVAFLGGTGPVGRASVPHVLAAGHEVAVAHTGRHEPEELLRADVEHLHGGRSDVLELVARWRPDAVVDTFAGGATAAKAGELRTLDVGRVVALSSIDVYRHCALAGVDDHEPAELPVDALPLAEDAPQRTGPSPAGGAARDNVAMEAAVRDAAPAVCVLRPGAIYGPFVHPAVLREWWLVSRVAAGERRLPLPAGGTQLFHRVAIDRVGRAVAAALDRAPDGFWACNVADPRDLTFGALARLVGDRLDWAWEPVDVAWGEADHPWEVRHPVLVDTSRLTGVLGVTEPDPLEATLAQIDWLWEHRGEVRRS